MLCMRSLGIVCCCADKLAHYAKVLPCVEVDTSSYAIPTNKRTGEWVKVMTLSLLILTPVW